MSLIVCVCDYWHNRHFHYQNQDTCAGSITASQTDQALSNGGKCNVLRRLKLHLDAISGNYWLRELLNHKALGQQLQQQGVQLIWLQLEPPDRNTIDYQLARMLSHTIWKRVEAEHMMSWLSTLGGGFSALGEQFQHCAETAGKISLKQLAIGLRLGDPFLQARCRLYYSISLIQCGKLALAKRLIRQQYRFAQKHQEHDIRLVRMCHGIWLRLRFEYAQRELPAAIAV